MKEYQAKMREFVSQTGLDRQGVRERVIFVPKPDEIRQSMGAALSGNIEKAQRRFEQTKSFTPEYSRQLKTAFATEELPNQEYHFEKHKDEFLDLGIQYEYQYIDAFNTHIRKQDLRYFTFLRPQKFREYEDAMWYLVDVENGMVAQYNESKRVFWTFFRHNDVSEFIKKTNKNLGLLQAIWNGETWEFKKI